MELIGLAVGGLVMVVVVLAVGITIQILFDRRFGVPRRSPDDARSQAHQQAVRSQLGGFGDQGGSQH